MAGRAAWPVCAFALLTLLASVAGNMLSWPECPCPNLPFYGTCTRIKTRQTPDNTNQLNVNLQHCNIKEISSSDFNYPHARWIDLRENYINRIDADVFKHLTRVEYLSLENNKFSGRSIDSEAFKKCTSLRGIGLNGNDMREAPHDLVEGLHNLEELHLMHSSLFEIPLFAKRASNLTLLYLSYNEITLPDHHTFSSFPNLKNLKLDHNRIGFIPENVFQPLTDIETIHLNNNRLSFIPDNLFAGLDKLKYLRLQNNAINYISEYVFRHIGNLEELDISNNRITQLSANFLTRLSQPKRFYFSGNPWECDYFNKFLNQVEDRQINHNNQMPYLCYKCLDIAFTDSVFEARTPDVRNNAFDQLANKIVPLNITILDYCH